MMLQMSPRMFQMAQRIVVALGVFLILGIAWVGYRWYHTSRDEQAHVTFARALDVYDQIKGASGDAKTALVERTRDVLNQGYAQYKRSSYGPLFLVFLSQLDIEAAKAAGATDSAERMITARDQLAQALKGMKTGTPLHDLYDIKRALMMTDADSDDVRAEGEAILARYAADTSSAFRDMALYYAGKLKFDALDYEGAMKLWDVLLKEYAAHTDQDASVWATKAQELKEYKAS